jgi:hypothetical protein
MADLPHGHNYVEAKVYKWEFKSRFRQRAFSWKSQPAIKRVNEAVSEIKKIGRKDKLLGAEGAVLFSRTDLPRPLSKSIVPRGPSGPRSTTQLPSSFQSLPRHRLTLRRGRSGWNGSGTPIKTMESRTSSCWATTGARSAHQRTWPQTGPSASSVPAKWPGARTRICAAFSRERPAA